MLPLSFVIIRRIDCDLLALKAILSFPFFLDAHSRSGSESLFHGAIQETKHIYRAV